jgi:hypothetical protein
MAELNLISVSEGPDLRLDEPVADSEFESLLADEVVVEWLRSLEASEALCATD